MRSEDSEHSRRPFTALQCNDLCDRNSDSGQWFLTILFANNHATIILNHAGRLAAAPQCGPAFSPKLLKLAEAVIISLNVSPSLQVRKLRIEVIFMVELTVVALKTVNCLLFLPWATIHVFLTILIANKFFLRTIRPCAFFRFPERLFGHNQLRTLQAHSKFNPTGFTQRRTTQS